MTARVRRLIADHLFRPRGLRQCGSSARIRYPRKLLGSECLSVGSRVRIEAHAWIQAMAEVNGQRFQPHIVIEDDVEIGRHFTLLACCAVQIGAGSLLSEGVFISDCDLDLAERSTAPVASRALRTPRRVAIGRRCFIGYRACIRPGVELGEHCIVGAQSVVTHSFGPGSVVAGCPARLLRVL